MAAGENISLDELNRNVDRLREDVKEGFKDLRSSTVGREVYEIDRKNTNSRLDAIEDDQASALKHRRNMMVVIGGSFLTSAAAIIAALIGAGAH